jgi:hypothetical protein
MLCCFYLTIAPFWGAAQTFYDEMGSDLSEEDAGMYDETDTGLSEEDAGTYDETGAGFSEEDAGTYDETGAGLSEEEVAGSDGDSAAFPLEDRLVALMTFVGDDLAISGELQGSVSSEIQILGGYTVQPISAEELPESLDFPPDEPPEPVYLGESELVLTGEYYVDMDDIQHLQMWLWRSESGSLVATEEMIFEDMEEAQSYVPAIVDWIFSRSLPEKTEEERTVFEKVVRSVEEVAAPLPPYNRRFYLGLRAGGAFNSLTTQGSGNYEAGASQWFGGEGALMAEFRLFRFLSLQTEAVFIYDLFNAARQSQENGELVRSTDTFRTMFLMFPLHIKLLLEINSFTLSPFLGAYLIMPLGTMNISSDGETGDGTYPYGIVPPLGMSLGFDVGFPLGAGELVTGLRVDQNVGLSSVQNINRMQYYRSQVTIFLGYKFLLWMQRR